MEESTLVLEKEEVAAPGSAARLIREVRRYTRRKFSAEDKIRIVLEGFRKEIPVSDLCRRESISSAIYYNWLKDFMEAGKVRMRGDSRRDATVDEVAEIESEITAARRERMGQTLTFARRERHPHPPPNPGGRMGQP